MKNSKKIFFIVWIIIILIALVSYFLFKDNIDISILKFYINKHYYLMMIIYVFLLSLRGLTLFPASPLLFIGLALFGPIELYIMNMVGIIISSLLVYNFSSYLGFDEYFESKYPQKIKKIKNAIKYKIVPIVIGWSFFPFVPTDLITYVCSSLGISRRKCIFGIFVGEGILMAFFVFSAHLIFF